MQQKILSKIGVLFHQICHHDCDQCLFGQWVLVKAVVDSEITGYPAFVPLLLLVNHQPAYTINLLGLYPTVAQRKCD